MKFIKNNLRVIIALLIAVILIVTGVILLNNDKPNNDNDNPVIDKKVTEDDIVVATGMTKEEAIEIVKVNFGSDNYEFSATATNDGLYKVTVTNVVDDSKIIYYVDPSNGSSYIDMNAE